MDRPHVCASTLRAKRWTPAKGQTSSQGSRQMDRPFRPRSLKDPDKWTDLLGPVGDARGILRRQRDRPLAGPRARRPIQRQKRRIRQKDRPLRIRQKDRPLRIRQKDRPLRIRQKDRPLRPRWGRAGYFQTTKGQTSCGTSGEATRRQMDRPLARPLVR